MKRTIDLPDGGLPGIAHGVVDAVIENFRDPAYRVEFAAGVITASLLASSRRRLTFLPALLISATAGKAARWAYESIEDMRAKITPSQLVYHGEGCPGHTTGKPAECCMGAPGAAGGI